MRKPIAKLFVNKHPDDRHSESMLIRLTKKDKAQIQKSAEWRHLATSEFVRRAALGRRTDVDYETAIILALADVGRSIRELHAGFVSQGMEPPEDILLPVLRAAEATTLSFRRVRIDVG